MSISAKASVKDPDATVIAIEITATVGEWKDLWSQLSNDYPSWRLGVVIGATLSKLLASHSATVETKP